jgi:hypothetical protein
MRVGGTVSQKLTGTPGNRSLTVAALIGAATVRERFPGLRDRLCEGVPV